MLKTGLSADNAEAIVLSPYAAKLHNDTRAAVRLKRFATESPTAHPGQPNALNTSSPYYTAARPVRLQMAYIHCTDLCFSVNTQAGSCFTG